MKDPAISSERRQAGAARGRPLSVTILGWLFIAAGLIGLAYHLSELKFREPFERDLIFALFVRLLAIVGGILMLRASDWGRWLLIAWMAYHVILSAFHSAAELAMHSVLLVVLVYFLLRQEADSYFRRPEGVS